MQRFGVFKLGQIWSVVSDGGQMRGFPNRHLALAAANELVEEARTYGGESEALVQDEAGRLISSAQPSQLIGVSGVPRGTIWDSLD